MKRINDGSVCEDGIGLFRALMVVMPLMIVLWLGIIWVVVRFWHIWHVLKGVLGI